MKKRITGFYVETLVLIAVFICIILVITQAFGAAKVKSTEAKLLTNSVALAENAAEAMSASADIEELAGLLDRGNIRLDSGGSQVEARYDRDMNPDPDGELKVTVQWSPVGPAGGDDGARVPDMAYGHISVTDTVSGKEIYSLDTASHLQ